MHSSNMKGTIEKLLKKDKARNIIIIAGLIGIALIYLSTFFNTDKKIEEAEPEGTFSISQYEEKLEEKLFGVVSAITGEETPKIMLTLESTGEFVYASDIKNSATDNDEYGEGGLKQTENSNDNETSYIILKDETGAEYALKITEIQPKIKGVVVVSTYADNILIKEKITNAVKTALGISSSKVCVVGTN